MLNKQGFFIGLQGGACISRYGCEYRKSQVSTADGGALGLVKFSSSPTCESKDK